LLFRTTTNKFREICIQLLEKPIFCIILASSSYPNQNLSFFYKSSVLVHVKSTSSPPFIHLNSTYPFPVLLLPFAIPSFLLCIQDVKYSSIARGWDEAPPNSGIHEYLRAVKVRLNPDISSIRGGKRAKLWLFVIVYQFKFHYLCIS